MLATFMEVLDTTVVNVSIPHIAGDLASTNEEGTWVVTSYLVSNAIVLPISGWLANYLGRKRLLLLCVAGFTVLRIDKQTRCRSGLGGANVCVPVLVVTYFVAGLQTSVGATTVTFGIGG